MIRFLAALLAVVVTPFLAVAGLLLAAGWEPGSPWVWVVAMALEALVIGGLLEAWSRRQRSRFDGARSAAIDYGVRARRPLVPSG